MRAPKAANAAYLERVALHYMERFPATEARVRRVLHRRVLRGVQAEKNDLASGLAAIEVVIAKLYGLGYLDDRRVAASRVRTLRARGKSTLAIRLDLRRLGVDAESLTEVLTGDREVEIDAARVYVRRRRLGRNQAQHDRDLARLARAGFSFDVARVALQEARAEQDADAGTD